MWEYHAIKAEAPLDAAQLNQFGKDGWELCGVVQDVMDTGKAIYYFKRPGVSEEQFLRSLQQEVVVGGFGVPE